MWGEEEEQLLQPLAYPQDWTHGGGVWLRSGPLGDPLAADVLSLPLRTAQAKPARSKLTRFAFSTGDLATVAHQVSALAAASRRGAPHSSSPRSAVLFSVRRPGSRPA